ncbi:MAG: hypothetical protein ACXADO_09985 [Candidatus Thorarchaeota archaeon]
MSEDIMVMRYEFFSWRGFLTGAAAIIAALTVQSVISFPAVWTERALLFGANLIFSGLVVGVASGGVLVFLFPPNQDIIGVAGLGSDDAPQYMSLALVVLALIQPILSGFLLFFDYFANDPLIVVWVIASFAAPSVGLTVAMFNRTAAIASDLRLYFSVNETLDMTALDWLQGVGPRTATYRMGMLESAARNLGGLRLSGHIIEREREYFQLTRK